jgi:6-phosphogluconolactonase
MKIEVLSDADAVARAAAAFVARAARERVATHGRFVMALSGGQTPWQMLRALANEEVPWSDVHLFQVDERIAPAGDADRNLTHLTECLQAVALPTENLHPMPVNEEDLAAACTRYAALLREVTGSGIFDLVHLGLGADGHTASLVPDDAALEVADRDVALCGLYQGRERMTLTYPALNRAASILWLVTGSSKVTMLRRLQSADTTIPAGRVCSTGATILADRAATGEV